LGCSRTEQQQENPLNEQLQGKLVEIITSIQETTRAAGTFAMEQLPDIAQQYVTYGRVFGTVESIVCMTALAALIYVTFRFGYFSKTPDEHGYWPAQRGGVVMAGSLSMLVAFVLTMCSLQSTLLVWFAPKVWLLKQLASLIK
jgi:hypothetical protein